MKQCTCRARVHRELASASRNRNSNFFSNSVLILLILLLAQCIAKAQIGSTATIQGTVTDPTGAVIPGAKVSVTSDATGVTITQETTGSGFYSI